MPREQTFTLEQLLQQKILFDTVEKLSREDLIEEFKNLYNLYIGTKNIYNQFLKEKF